MLKLFRTSHAHLIQTPKILFKAPNVLTPISHLHNSGETLVSDSEQEEFISNKNNEVEEKVPLTKSFEQRDLFARENVQWFDQRHPMKKHRVGISHPWPEWIELMKQLYNYGYFEEVGNPFCNGEMDAKAANRIRTACLNFARDQTDLIRYFSSKDIQVIVGSGCPVTDRKVVNSGKRLRAHVSIDEGHVCSCCSLRGNCDRAYMRSREGEDGRTVDIMRLLLTYGLDPISGTVKNNPCLNRLVEESVRRLLKEMVERSVKELKSDSPTATFTKRNSSVEESAIRHGQGYISVSIKQGDWICSKCNFINLARNTKCLHCDGGLFPERPRKVVENQDRLSLKKGDWICAKCDFLNFAKNTRCLQCNENPPKRQLHRGEWECDSCNYVNFRRNRVCIKCDHRRPRVSHYGEH